MRDDDEIELPDGIKTVGRAVRWLRKYRGMSLGKLAKLTGRTHNSLSSFESCPKPSRPRDIELFAAVLDVPVALLEGLCPEREQPTPRGWASRSRCARCGSPDHHITACAQPRKKPKACRLCEDLAHRRPMKGLCVCGRRYQAEPAARAVAGLGSSAGTCADAGYACRESAA